MSNESKNVLASGSNSHVCSSTINTTAGPNAQELNWAFETATNDQDAPSTQEIEALLAEDETEEQTEPSTSTSTSTTNGTAAQRKKAKSKALAKIKKKLAGNSNTNGSTATTTKSTQEAEPLPEQFYEAVKTQMQEKGGEAMANKLTPEMLSALLKKAQLDQVARGKAGLGGKNKKDMADYKFWDTQPVPKLGTTSSIEQDKEIEPNKPLEEIRQEPYPMREPYEWSTIDLNDEEQLHEVYNLLTKHYVEDDDASFRFDYTAEFFKWALQPPGYVQDWHVGVRAQSTKKLVAFISGIPMETRVRQTVKKCSEINFLVVHKKLRSNRLAPLLIQEVTRRCNMAGVFQAVYTAGVFLPTPVARSQYFHRTLNPKKLVATGFTSLPRHQTMSSMIKSTAVPSSTSIPCLREMEEKDVQQVSVLLRAYMSRFEIAPVFSDQEVSHMFLTGRGSGDVQSNGRRKGQVTWSFVVENPKTHLITDFFSFYYLPSTAIKAKQTIEAAYLFYYATSVGTSTASNPQEATTSEPHSWQNESGPERVALKKRLVELVQDALSIAKAAQFDVFNALTLMDNTLFLGELKFGRGDGFLHYYLYNWMARPIRGGISGEDFGDGRAVSAPLSGLSSAECGSGVGIVML